MSIRKFLPHKTPIKKREANYSFSPQSEEIRWKGCDKSIFEDTSRSYLLPTDDERFYLQRDSEETMEYNKSIRKLLPDMCPRRRIPTDLEKQESLNRLRAYTKAAIGPS
jgi:hypothetical protein